LDVVSALAEAAEVTLAESGYRKAADLLHRLLTGKSCKDDGIFGERSWVSRQGRLEIAEQSRMTNLNPKQAIRPTDSD
jgi:hypothetical protein